MATFAVAFLAVFALHEVVARARSIVALLLAAGVTFIVRGLFPANADLREYNLDSRRRVKKVFASVANIEKLARAGDRPQAQRSPPRRLQDHPAADPADASSRRR